MLVWKSQLVELTHQLRCYADERNCSSAKTIRKQITSTKIIFMSQVILHSINRERIESLTISYNLSIVASSTTASSLLVLASNAPVFLLLHVKYALPVLDFVITWAQKTQLLLVQHLDTHYTVTLQISASLSLSSTHPMLSQWCGTSSSSFGKDKVVLRRTRPQMGP